MLGADELTAHDRLATSVGLAIAAIHSLPTGFIADAGLPRQTAEQSRDAVVELVGRAADTGHLPAAILRRWEEATDDDALWRFRPTVVNGALTADSILVEGDTVSGVLGWSSLAESDPARDLHWLLTSRGQAAEAALGAYVGARNGGADAHLPQRALLYGELELARWLLHGVDARDEAIVDDAVGLLDGLVESVHDRSSEPLSPETGPILAVGDVERMLDETPHDRLAQERGSDPADRQLRLLGARAPRGGRTSHPAHGCDRADAARPERLGRCDAAAAPIPGAAADEHQADAGDAADASDAAASTDAQARRNAASS